MSKTRLYKVSSPSGITLVEASSVHRAVSHVAGKEITAEIPTQSEAFALGQQGLQVEIAGAVPAVSDETRNALSQSQIPV